MGNLDNKPNYKHHNKVTPVLSAARVSTLKALDPTVSACKYTTRR